MGKDEKSKNWFKRHPVLSVLIALIVFALIGSQIDDTKYSEGVQISDKIDVNLVKTEAITEFNYRDVIRNPENYTGKSIYMEGIIFQKINNNEALFKKNYYDDNIYYITFPNVEKLLDEDRIGIYGIIEGKVDYETRIGTQTAPKIKIVEMTVKEINKTYTFY